LGPTPITLYNGLKYFIIFIDDFSKTLWLYLLKTKEKVFNYFFENRNTINGKFKNFRSDNGTKFINNNFQSFCKDKEIIHQTSCIYTSEQNGVMERKKIDIY
jgi:transposase InsO family protein